MCRAATVARQPKTQGEHPQSRAIVLRDLLEARVMQDGIAERNAYRAYTEWCDEASHTHVSEIATAKSSAEKLNARNAS